VPAPVDTPTQSTFGSYLEKRNPSGLGWKRRFFTIDETQGVIFYFKNMESPNSLGMIRIAHVERVAPNDRGKFCFALEMRNSRVYYLDAASDSLRADWIRRIQLCRKADQEAKFYETINRPISVKMENVPVHISEESLNEFTLCGTLSKLGVTGGWRKRYFDYSAHDNVLSYRTKKGKQKELGNIHLRKILSVKRGAVGKDANRCFELESAMRVYYLRAANEFERELWVQTILSEMEHLKSQNLDQVKEIVSSFMITNSIVC
jgi:hypothetical protein